MNALKEMRWMAAVASLLSLQALAHEACIEVSDSGPGLPQALLQSPADTQPVVDWFGGLGLYMTRGILQQFGGSLALDNDGADGGACVRLMLPLAPGQAD